MTIEIENVSFENKQQPIKPMWEEWIKQTQNFPLSKEEREEAFWQYYEKYRKDEERQAITEQDNKTQAQGQINLNGKSDDYMPNIAQTEKTHEKEGNIELEETYKYFNQQQNYVEKRGVAQGISNVLSRKEAVFVNTNDQSQVHVYKNRLKIDPTPENIQASLDLAKDKGWTTIKITGGSKENRAQLWLQAQLQGFDTRGYKPTKVDIKMLQGALARQQEQEIGQQNQSQELEKDLEIKPKIAEQEAPQQETKEPGQEAKTPEQEAPQQEAKAPEQAPRQEEMSPQERLINKEHDNIMNGFFKYAKNVDYAAVQKISENLKKDMYQSAEKGDQHLKDFIEKSKKEIPEMGLKMQQEHEKENYGRVITTKELIAETKKEAAEDQKAWEEKNKEPKQSQIEKRIENASMEIANLCMKQIPNASYDDFKKINENLKNQMSQLLTTKGEQSLNKFIKISKEGVPQLANQFKQTIQQEKAQAPKQQQRQKENTHTR